jgi:hypothetical protein
MEKNRMNSKGIYYLARKASQFTSVAPLWQAIGGKFLTWEIERNRIAKMYPFRKWKMYLFQKTRDLHSFYRQLTSLFPGCESDSIKHFYFGPYPSDLEKLVCTTMWPIPPRSERPFIAFQFYHGVCDKRFKVGGKRTELPPMFDHWDYWMLSGEKDRQKVIKSCEESNIVLRPGQLVEIGHLRFDKIINHEYDQTALMRQAGIPDNGRKNILFAPTWKWGGGTLMSHYQLFCDIIPQHYNLIIRPHTNDDQNIGIVKNYCREKQIRNVYFVDNSMMNITDNITFTDLMISDSSSVMYDFLILDRPLIINKTSSKDVFEPEDRFNIKRCGFEFDLEKDNILDTIERSLITDQFKLAIADVRQSCFYHLDGKATERAADFILNVED